jgi:NADPH:quinone reductase-like Zn-dependent oxidoreductase
MHAYQIQPGQLDSLTRTDLPRVALAPGQVRVRLHAAGLNYRDLMFAWGHYGPGQRERVIPLTDGAGEVIETAPGVTRVKVGDRVANTYFPDWIDGEPTPASTALTYGTTLDGVLADEAVFDAEALVHVPAHLEWAEAAALACAGITAWNALFVEGRLKPGGTALMLGTGGVSMWALQLARAAGARTVITSSDDGKLARARDLGAHETINYRDTPEWQDEVLRHTAGRGVDVVVEVGGQGTLQRSIASARMGGHVSVVGGVSGFTSELSLIPLLAGARRLSGIFVGHRTMFEDLLRFVALHQIRPVVDQATPLPPMPAWQAAGMWARSSSICRVRTWPGTAHPACAVR